MSEQHDARAEGIHFAEVLSD